jgi:membrane-associated protein
LTLAAHRAREHLEVYGVGRAVALARFVPGIRTVMNPLAGALRIDVRVFTQWQVIGGAIWTVGLVLAGHVLGSQVPNIDRYLLPLIVVIVMLSLIPVVLEVVRRRNGSRPAA